MLDFMMLNNTEEMLSCVYAKKLLDRLWLINLDLPKNQQINLSEIEKAIIYAKYYHADQKRESGEPYYSHPLEVAYMVADYLPRTDIIVTTILHDTLEDTKITKREIATAFSEQIAEQVYDLTRIKENGIKITSAKMLEELWLQEKYDVALIKLFDRIHNMQTIGSKSPDKIKKILEETIKNFIILAECLEFPDIAHILNAICASLQRILDFTKENEVDFAFSFKDDYQPLSLIYQSNLYRKHTLQ